MNRRWYWLYPILAISLLVLAWLGPLDRLAEDQAQAGLKRALATFATARALNGIISVAQGTEVAVEPGGIGVTFAPGQVLDPINDLLEQFSTLMLTASVSFAAQSAMVAMGSHWIMSLLLTLAMVIWLLWSHIRHESAPLAMGRVLMLLLLVRFAVPVAALGSDAAFRWFLSDRYEESQAALALDSAKVGELAAPVQTSTPDASIGDRLQRWWTDTGQSLDVGRRLEALKESATRVTEHIVELIVVFLLQTLIIPTALLWLIWRAALGLVHK